MSRETSEKCLNVNPLASKQPKTNHWTERSYQRELVEIDGPLMKEKEPKKVESDPIAFSKWHLRRGLHGVLGRNCKMPQEELAFGYYSQRTKELSVTVLLRIYNNQRGRGQPACQEWLQRKKYLSSSHRFPLNAAFKQEVMKSGL